MLKSLSFFLRYFLFWVIFFAINRIAFEIWNSVKLSGISFSDILKTFWYGAHMDASMAGYFCVLPFILQIISWFAPRIASFKKKFIFNYSYILLVVTAILTIIDFNIYTEWGTKMNARALDFFFTSPSEALASSASSPVFSSLMVLALLCIAGIFLFRMITGSSERKTLQTSWFIKLPVGLLLLGFTFLFIRGGWGLSPMNPSKSYFSNQSILNHSALNTNWLLLSNYLKKSDHHNPYQFYPKEEARKVATGMFDRSDSGQVEILNNKRPNVVIFLLESFTADVVKELGGESGITPAFSELIKEGLLFNNIYSSGDRTDKGLVSVLSAFPSQAIKSIIKENDKQEKLPSIMQSLAAEGYHTSFYYGGDIGFSNFGSYLLAHQTQTLFDSHQLPSKDLTSKWGAYDGVTMDEHLKFLTAEKQPFFSTLLTLSNHEPFELPRPGTFPNGTIENKFKNTSQYTAECLLNYIREAKKQDWYQNTLFVFVADHGHRLPKNTHEIYMHERYHIPLLLLGGALKSEFAGQVYDKVGGQTDIVPSLLSQMNIDDGAYVYGSNIFSPNHGGFAFYCWDNGFGLVNKTGAVSFDGVSRNIILTSPKDLEKEQTERTLAKAKALMQSVFQDYLDM